MTEMDAEKLRALVKRLQRYGGLAFPHEDKSGREETCLEAANTILALVEERDRLTKPRPFDAWSEDHHDVLWHLMPIQEPPFCGTPHDSSWPYAIADEARLWWTPLPDCNAINERWAALTPASTEKGEGE